MERAYNQPSGADAPPVDADDYHPVLQDRIRSQQQLQDGQTAHLRQPGSHAEVLVLDKALKARDAAHRDDPSIPPVSEDNLDEFTQRPVWACEEGRVAPHMVPGEPAPCCGNCAPITRGTNNTSGDAAPWAWKDSQWVRPPKKTT